MGSSTSAGRKYTTSRVRYEGMWSRMRSADVPVRVEKRGSPTGVDSLQEKVFHQPRLPGTRLADDIQMPAPVFIGDEKWKRFVPHVVSTKIYGMSFVINRSKPSPSSSQEPEMVSSFSSQKENGLLRRVSKKKCLSLPL